MESIPGRHPGPHAIDESDLLRSVLPTTAATAAVSGVVSEVANGCGTQPEPAVSTDLARLLRWEESGGTWRIIHRRSASVTVALNRCDGGEEADRYTTQEPDVVAYARGRQSSED